MKTSWRFLSSSPSEDVLKTSSRRLDQDEYICLSHASSEDVFKTNIFVLAIGLVHLGQRHLLNIFKTSSRRLQDTFKTSSKRLQGVFKTLSGRLAKMSSKRLQGVLQKRLEDIFKTSSRRLWDLLQDVFKTYHQIKLLTSLRNVLNKFLRCTAKTVICRRICLGHASEKFMVSVQNLQEW